jgi:glycosyltransferase involved in cell wall biosynthesis
VHVGIGLLTLRPGELGGSETLVHGLLSSLGDAREDSYSAFCGPLAARSLARHARGAVSVHALAGHRTGRDAAQRLLAIARARYLGGGMAREAERRAGGRFDVVHFPLTISAPRFDSPRVVTVLDLQHELMPAFFSAPERAYRRVFYAGAIREAAVLVTISEWVKGTIVERHGVDPDRILVSLQAIDRELFRPGPVPEDEERLASLDLPERFVVYPANLWPHKNHERLVEALGRTRDPELGLVLTGQRYGRWEALEARAAQVGVGGRIRHLGYVGRALLPALYRRARGMVFPSLFEGLGIPPLEALACGCPVAAADRAALPEMLEDRALLFDPESTEAVAAALDALASGGAPRPDPDPGFWRRFTWDAAADVHRAAYRLAADGAATR